jgi:DNA modification methylase
MSLQLQEFCNFNLSGLRKIQGMGSLIGRSTNSYLSSSRVPQNWVSMGRYRTNIWRSAGVNSFGADRSDLVLHPTVKSVAMVADALRDCSHRKGIGLDAFVGSGTTLIAAEQTGRRGFGIEIDPLYCDVTIRRLHAVCARGVHWPDIAAVSIGGH